MIVALLPRRNPHGRPDQINQATGCTSQRRTTGEIGQGAWTIGIHPPACQRFPVEGDPLRECVAREDLLSGGQFSSSTARVCFRESASSSIERSSLLNRNQPLFQMMTIVNAAARIRVTATVSLKCIAVLHQTSQDRPEEIADRNQAISPATKIAKVCLIPRRAVACQVRACLKGRFSPQVVSRKSVVLLSK
jgi:hypothetical protein